MLSVGNGVRSKQSVRKSVPEGHLIVAQYAVLGNCVKRYVRPRETIERPALGPHAASRAQATIDRPYGPRFSLDSRHFVPGYYRNVLPGHKWAFRKRKRSKPETDRSNSETPPTMRVVRRIRNSNRAETSQSVQVYKGSKSLVRSRRAITLS